MNKLLKIPRRLLFILTFLTWMALGIIIIIAQLVVYIFTGNSNLIRWYENSRLTSHILHGDPIISKASPGPGKFPYDFKTVHLLPLEKQAQYADAVCRQHCRDHFTLEESLGNADPADLSQYKNFNLASVGNLAYIALNSPEPYATHALDLLNGFKEYRSLLNPEPPIGTSILNLPPDRLKTPGP
jgi:hypothetical protein